MKDTRWLMSILNGFLILMAQKERHPLNSNSNPHMQTQTPKTQLKNTFTGYISDSYKNFTDRPATLLFHNLHYLDVYTWPSPYYHIPCCAYKGVSVKAWAWSFASSSAHLWQDCFAHGSNGYILAELRQNKQAGRIVEHRLLMSHQKNNPH